MKYNVNYINIKYALVKALMFNANKNILDISYHNIDKKIEIQIILLKDSILPEQFEKIIKENLHGFNLSIKKIYLTKAQFNENIGEWTPKYYEWLDNVLFSKAEVL